LPPRGPEVFESRPDLVGPEFCTNFIICELLLSSSRNEIPSFVHAKRAFRIEARKLIDSRYFRADLGFEGFQLAQRSRHNDLANGTTDCPIDLAARRYALIEKLRPLLSGDPDGTTRSL
jgi:hypothetical protein